MMLGQKSNNRISRILPKRREEEKKRIFEIDYLRGIAVFLMILFHACFDLYFLFSDFFSFPDCSKVPQFVYNLQELGRAIWVGQEYKDLITLMQHLFAGLFMFICGISCHFSRNNLKRGIQLAYISVFLTIFLDFISNFAQNYLDINLNIHIYFGILHSLALAILVYSLINRFTDSYWATFIAGIIFFLITVFVTDFNAPTQYSITGDYDYWTYKQPYFVMPQFHKLLLGKSWDGDDYFYPAQTLAFLLYGATFAKIVYKDKKQLWPKKLITPIGKAISHLGKHALEAYVMHQLVILVVLYIILAPFGATLGGNGNLRCYP